MTVWLPCCLLANGKIVICLLLFRPDGFAEKQISMHCSESGLVTTLQVLTSLLPEAAGKTEVIPLAEVSLKR